ncbi:hypothetical protein M8C21_009986 [Ambrosia artemisiifolia]|uniref:Uncharacterized protein n=1 Tax=Ambrosia artemisiifolia TaxID=4212 RepID=A0AAD5GV82_AMBAR|nr:hypothetical protein M8C21_009986 [Ambrosia artemisiifolia]
MDLESDRLKDNGNCDAENVEAKLTNAIGVGEGAVGKTELSAVGLSPSPATKGRGLKKWRRIHRESGKETSNNFDSNRKRGMAALPVGVKQSEGSSSSTNAMSNVLGNALDHISLYGDLGRKGPEFGSRADSDNSEDRNSRSSTAASAPRGNREVPVVGFGFNLSANNSGILLQHSDRQEKSQNSTKKARGGRIKKENSISSVESDSRSSNFVFLQAANSMTRNGRVNGRSGNYDEDDSDDARNGGSLNYVSQTKFSKNEADYENVSHEDLAGEKVDDHVGLGNPDPLVESFIPLHLAQEALEREVEKLRDVGKEDILSSEADLQSKLEEAFNALELKDTKVSELESTLNLTKIKTEYEELLRQRIAAEVEYLVISKTIQNLKAGHMDRINLAVDQKTVSATAPVPEPASVEEDARKLKNRVWRYVCCLIIQSVLLLVVLYIVGLKFSSKTVEVIPT